MTLTLTLAPDVEGFAQAPCGCQLARQRGEKSKAAFVVFTACKVHAAAPEMCEALEAIVMRLGSLGANADVNHPCRASWEIARAAINKATR